MLWDFAQYRLSSWDITPSVQYPSFPPSSSVSEEESSGAQLSAEHRLSSARHADILTPRTPWHHLDAPHSSQLVGDFLLASDIFMGSTYSCSFPKTCLSTRTFYFYFLRVVSVAWMITRVSLLLSGSSSLRRMSSFLHLALLLQLALWEKVRKRDRLWLT